MMKVSILVPVYGVEKYIERCAISLFGQTYDNIEYVFVNDCTRDKSMVILKNILNRYPCRKSQVKIIEHDRNKGLGEARNTAVAAATGEFLMHVDSDDYIDTTCIEKCVHKQIESGADIVSFDAVCERPQYTGLLKLTNEASKEDTIIKMMDGLIPHVIWGRLIRTSLYTNNKLQVEGGCGMGEDTQVVPRLIYCSESIANLNEVLYYYNCLNENSYTYSFSVSKSKQALYANDVLRFFFKEKEDKYIDVVNYREVRVLAKHIIDSVKRSPVNKEYYLQLRARFRACLKEYKRTLSFPVKVGLFIENYFLFVSYVRLTSFIKTCIKKCVRFCSFYH